MLHALHRTSRPSGSPSPHLSEGGTDTLLGSEDVATMCSCQRLCFQAVERTHSAVASAPQSLRLRRAQTLVCTRGG
eukprot:5167118-Amphidinium_carterae.1